MKKLLLGALLVLVLLIVGVYMYIPAAITVTNIELVKCSPGGALRVLNNKDKWALWWPGDSVRANTHYRYNGFDYTISQDYLIGTIISITKGDLHSSGAVRVLPLGPDSAAIEWKTDFPSTRNPIRRVMLYRDGEQLKNAMSDILGRAKMFLEKPENVYGMKIIKSKVTDTLLVSTKSTMTHWPTVDEIYGLIASLRAYASRNGAQLVDSPMLHVRYPDSSHYEVMVALPVNKALPGAGAIVPKTMVKGNILVSEVKGGPYSIRQAFRQFANYVNDYGRQSPAIPFESLITDRQTQPDTTKWTTRLNIPVY